MEFKDRLKALRKIEKISQKELSEKADIHVTNISRYERGENMPTTEVVSKLSSILNTTTDYLLNGISIEKELEDNNMKSLLKRLELLPKEKQNVVVELIQSFLFQNDIENKLKSK